jgi:HAD superfamily hydrolase (TIGR01459 family)
MSSAPFSFITHFAELAAGYDVLLCDVWGVLHNGAATTPEACDALRRFRERGGTVILVTNAPRPGAFVIQFLDRMKVPRTSFDGIVASGDVTRALVAKHAGKRVFHLGPERDLGLFDGLDVHPASIESAEVVLCSGLFDDTKETPQDYAGLIETMRRRGLPMICANPDVVVERGNRLVYCAGAIADLYLAAGGAVEFGGKPYRPIYEQALAAAKESRGHSVAQERVLAIGDSVRTDLKGAAAFGIDCLFVTAGIHAEELGARDTPDAAVLGRLFTAAGVHPKAVATKLVW